MDDHLAASGSISGNNNNAGAETIDASQKRTRVLLSCAPCRTSKLKCDRAVPCSQCLKKCRPSLCVYAPRPVKKKAPKSIAAQLRRLEGMVRGMLDEEGNPKSTQPEPLPASNDECEVEENYASGKVIHANGGQGRSTTYIGATHFMAMLDDIEDLKSYFDEDTEDSVGESPDDATHETDSGSLIMTNLDSVGYQTRSKQDLLSLLPPKNVADRLVMRYFSSGSASLHIVHRPAFVKKYTEFWADPTSPSVNLDWLALLYMVLALAIFFSSFSAPHELALDNTTLTPKQRFRQYRTMANWALTESARGGGNYSYTSPATSILAPFLLYGESELLLNTRSYMQCYLLLSVVIRIMLRMGLHRDPSKLPDANISAYDGEMRRRIWNLAIQVDLMVSFHLGLPSMIDGIESDTLPPHNLLDDDFDENTTELPPERTAADYTPMTYPIYKASIMKVFGQVARQAHSLTVPTYADVMQIDVRLEEVWSRVPSYMIVRPLDTAMADPPFQVIQRFGIGSLYQKARCVLHRRYLVEKEPKVEHAYSRRVCLLGALALLEYQNMLFEATKPGALLSQNGWFVPSLSMHDFLLGAMIVYLVIQNEKYNEPGGDFDWMKKDTPLPNKKQLLETLKRSYRIWREVVVNNSAVKKAPEVLEGMFRKMAVSFEARGESFLLADVLTDAKPEAPVARLGFPLGNLKLNGSSSTTSTAYVSPESQTPLTRDGFMKSPMAENSGITWLPEEIDMVDWTSLETVFRANSNLEPSATEEWLGPDITFDQINSAGLNAVNEPFWPGQ